MVSRRQSKTGGGFGSSNGVSNRICWAQPENSRLFYDVAKVDRNGNFLAVTLSCRGKLPILRSNLLDNRKPEPAPANGQASYERRI
ncbi:MAG: hypothetical protein C4576_24520 [Desulfobacteraceae bacterium]|nr:MAG: hypothetical protein C4576_24520 [Desulfobacteraceae bacterium]